MKLKKQDWTISQIHQNEAIPFVEKWHYAHGTANTSVVCFGLFYKGDTKTLHGISWWMPPIIGAAKWANPEHRKVLALSRFCLIEGRPDNSGSFLISGSIKMLDRKKYSTLLTYADTALNHKGTIYQASNWTYRGLSGKNAMWWDKENNKMISCKRGAKTFNRQEMLGQGHEFVGKFSKHRFVYPLSRRGIVITPIEKQLELKFNNKGNIIDNNKGEKPN